MGWIGKRGGGIARGAAAPTLGIVLGVGFMLASPSGSGAQVLDQSRYLVDTPTAGLNPAGAFETRTRLFPGGGLELRVDIGLAHWLSLGASYGGLQIIGDGEPDWYPEPGFFVKARILQEDYAIPAVAIGIDTQGAGFYDRERERFQYKSRGFFAVVSKNYAWFGDLSLHGGMSRSLEGSDENISPFLGFEKSLGSYWGLALEYDVATNDDRNDGAYGKGRGYLNGVLSWNLAPQMQARFVIRDMLRNSEAVEPGDTDVIVDEGWGREFSFSYVEQF